jgi:endonuclease YncB( thermonuclease family)
MVLNGWALSFVKYSHAYDADEAAARDAHAGLWSGALLRRGVGATGIAER